MHDQCAAADAHDVQFYEDERFLHGAVAAFFREGLERGEPLVMIARGRTFDGVAGRLSSMFGLSPIDTASRILFVDVDTVRQAFLDGLPPDAADMEGSFSALLAEARRGRTDGRVWLYGETVDVLCREGHYAAAVWLEELWNGLSVRQGVSVLCGYSMDAVDAGLEAGQIQTICRHHTHVVPPEACSNAPEGPACDAVALVERHARARQRAREGAPPAAPAADASAETVYVVDDDASVRRSLARLLEAVHLRVQTFASAEAFLAEVDESSNGCLVLDLQLVGMSGSDLQTRMEAAGWPMPVIAMSGSQDERIEMDALRLGARVFLRKPFEADALINAIARVLS